MKKTIINSLGARAILVGLAACMTAPWWAIWFIIFPALYVDAIVLLKVNGIAK